MSPTDTPRLMARYNRWMNQKLYVACAKLPVEQVRQEQGAFFGSLYGTLNHLAVADTIWLQRCARHPARFAALKGVAELATPKALAMPLFATFAQLQGYRTWLDGVIEAWVAQLEDKHLDHMLHYANTAGTLYSRRFDALIQHFFNHQTHHRGQATTLLAQMGVDVGVTDLLALIGN